MFSRIFFALIGALWGMSFNNPLLGLIIGFWLGGAFGDNRIRMQMNYGHHRHSRIHNRQQAVFFYSTFAVMGYIAKADGRISDGEIAFAKAMMDQFKLQGKVREEAIAAFRKGKSTHFNLDECLRQLIQMGFLQPALLDTFLAIQIQAARAQGALHPQKQKILEYVGQYLGRPFTYQHQQHTPSSHTQQPLSECYACLNVRPEDDPKTIKKAYRKLRGQYHPDKLISQGLPQEMLNEAKQKFQIIKKSYDQIREARGF